MRKPIRRRFIVTINHGKNRKQLEKYRVLEEYALFVETSRQYLAEGMERQEALNLAIDYCIDHGILSEFLRRYRAEVLGVLLEEFDVDKYEKSLREEGREEGRKEGQEQGTERAFKLMQKLQEQNRQKDLERAGKDLEYREKLFREFGL